MTLKKTIQCYIMYKWEDEDDDKWVEELATNLRAIGIKSKLDKWDFQGGKNLLQSMEMGIVESDYTIMICTPIFAQNVNNREGGVGFEANIIIPLLNEKKDHVIPIIRKGNSKSAVPTALKHLLSIDFTKTSNYFSNLVKLTNTLYRRIDSPKLGESIPEDEIIDIKLILNRIVNQKMQKISEKLKKQNIFQIDHNRLLDLAKSLTKSNNVRLARDIYLILALYWLRSNEEMLALGCMEELTSLLNDCDIKSIPTNDYVKTVSRSFEEEFKRVLKFVQSKAK